MIQESRMARRQLSDFIQRLRTAMLLDDDAKLTDGQLLGRFIDHQDEAAFAALVRKHGPMVWGVCRRLLQWQDAEDAFQATFLVLVRRAASVIPRKMVANWIYGVAQRTALKARATVAKRNKRERQLIEMPDAPTEQLDLESHLRPVLDQELACLPDKYRVALVLCDLEGKTRKEAARQLGVPEGTVASRLNRGRTLLAKRLSRHGLPVSGSALAAVLSQNAKASVPLSLVSSTTSACSLVASGQGVGGTISVKVAALMEGVVKTMFVTKLAKLTVVSVAFLVMGVQLSNLPYPALAQDRAEPTTRDESHKQAGEPTKKERGIRKADLDLRGRLDLTAVDLGKRIITGYELLPGVGENVSLVLVGENGSWVLGDQWKLSVGPARQIIIDGKKAQLEDLKKVIDAARHDHPIRVSGEWEFEVLKPRHSEQTGNAICIEVKGPQDDGLVEAVDVAKRVVTIPRFKVSGTHKLAADAQVVIDGKAASLANLKPNMHVSLQMSAVKNTPDVAVTASGPKVEGVVKNLNAEKNTIGVSIPSVQVTAECVPVAVDAKVVIDGKQGKLSDLKAGMRVTLQMCAEMEKSLVIGITTGNAANER
jgi:RNA polymerase sigma factor (sigma-70 family)